MGIAIGYRCDSKGHRKSAALGTGSYHERGRGLIYRGDAAEIQATARHMALNMLRAEEGKRASILRKQKISAMNSDYQEQEILAGIRAANKN
ncbi:hypothetical protein C7R88_15885 (plasmid) [Plesiomonas shigelloides]|nr:hypothetical protein C7R88_15885 [Plesiomonas shigelloides]